MARLGGDEFVVLLVDLLKANYAGLIANKILNEISAPILLEQNEVVVTCSIGIATYPADGDSADSLLKNADTAMYRAKDVGRNNAQFFTAKMNVQAQKRLQVEDELRKALKNDEFILYFQPQYNIESQCITGCEALIRWLHPQKGLVLPDEFILIAEETGLIKPIGLWVIEQACSARARWNKAGIDNFPVAINISSKQLIDQNLTNEIESILNRTNLTGSDITLELAESTVMENVDITAKTLQKLHQMDIKIAIDDFGTGYSSIVYLKKLPIGQLKIEQKFIQNITSQPENKAIVRATTFMANGMNIKVLAEGVETQEQLDFLKEIGCDEAQGFLFNKPLSEAPFIQYVSGYSKK